MKKVILLFIMAVATATLLPAQYRSQPKSSRVGIRFGGNINKVVSKIENKTESGDGMLAFHLALTADFRLAGNLYLSTGAWYITKGDAFVSEGWEEDTKYKSISSLSYIEVPLQASFIYP
ncbi:MAG: PorT family protein, partial [Bacteroidetes bacterium]|nr:PorT family protein [Bacteroidota bacterium]